MAVSDEDLIERLAAVQKSIDGVRSDLGRRVKVTRRAVVASLAVAVLGLIVGGLGVRAQINATNNTRTARIASCQGYNGQQEQGIVAADTHDAVEAANLAPLPRTPAVQRRVDVYLAQEHKASVKGHPLRDCTPRGISDFLSGTTRAPGTSTRALTGPERR